MKSLVQFLFLIAISIGLSVPAAEAKKTTKNSQRSELPHKKGARKPAAQNKKQNKKHNKKSAKKHAKKKSGKQGHKKHKASAGEMRARQYLSSSGR